MGRPHAGLYQLGPGPVVELAVGDPSGRAGGGTTVADVVGMGGELLVAEQQALLPRMLNRGAACPRLAVGAPGYRHTCLRPGNASPWALVSHARPTGWARQRPRAARRGQPSRTLLTPP